MDYIVNIYEMSLGTSNYNGVGKDGWEVLGLGDSKEKKNAILQGSTCSCDFQIHDTVIILLFSQRRS